MVQYFKSLEYIGPFRDSPKRTYLFSGESPTSIGKSGEKAIDIIASDYMKRGGKKRKIVENVSKWLNVCEIASGLDLKVLTDRHFELRLSNIKSNENEIKVYLTDEDEEAFKRKILKNEKRDSRKCENRDLPQIM